MKKKTKMFLSIGTLITTLSIGGTIFSQIAINNINFNNKKTLNSLDSNQFKVLKNDSSNTLENENNFFSIFENTFKSWLAEQSNLSSNNLITNSSQTQIENIIRKRWFIAIINNIISSNFSQLTIFQNFVNSFINNNILASNFLSSSTNLTTNTLNSQQQQQLISIYLQNLNTNLLSWLNSSNSYPLLSEAISNIGNSPSANDVEEVVNNLNSFLNNASSSINLNIIQQRNATLEDQFENDLNTLQNINVSVSLNNPSINGFFLNPNNFIFSSPNPNVLVQFTNFQLNTRSLTINTLNSNSIGTSVIVNFNLKLGNATLNSFSILNNLDNLNIFLKNQTASTINNLQKPNGLVLKNSNSISENDVPSLTSNDFVITNPNPFFIYNFVSAQINNDNNLVVTYILSPNENNNVTNINGSSFSNSSSFFMRNSTEISITLQPILTPTQINQFNLINNNLEIIPQILDNSTFIPMISNNSFNPTPLTVLNAIETNNQLINSYFKYQLINEQNTNISISNISNINNDFGFINITYIIKNNNLSKVFNRNIIGYKGLTPIADAIQTFNTNFLNQLNVNFPGVGSIIYNQVAISNLVGSTALNLEANTNFNQLVSLYKSNFSNQVGTKISNLVLETMAELQKENLENTPISSSNKESLANSINKKTSEAIKTLENQLINAGINPKSAAQQINQINDASINLLNSLEKSDTLEQFLNNPDLKNYLKILSEFDFSSPSQINNFVNSLPNIQKIVTDTQKGVLYAVSAIAGISIILLFGVIYKINSKKRNKIRSSKAITLASIGMITIFVAILIYIIIQSLGGF